jgi:hypothetical protein
MPWNQPLILHRPAGNGTWHVRVVRDGRYAITLRERPAVAQFTLLATEAQLRIGDREKLTQVIPADSTAARFEVDLKQGITEIQTWLNEPDGKTRGAYFIEIEWLAPLKEKP